MLSLGIFRHLRRMSIAGRWALATVALQATLVVLAAVVAVMAGDRAVIQLWWSPWKALVMLGLLVVVPGLVYQSVRLWTHHGDSSVADLAAALRGIDATLDRLGVRLSDRPLFLVLGTDGGTEEKAFLEHDRPSLLVSAAPGPGGPLHVYATDQAIYLCLSDCGQLGDVNRSVRTALRVTGAAESEPQTVSSRTASVQVRTREQQLRGAGRLQWLCDQLVRRRFPLVPINGLVALVPLATSQRPESESIELGLSLGEDLAILTESLGARFPVLVLAEGLEEDPALDELLRTASVTMRAGAVGISHPVGLPITADDCWPIAVNAVGPLVDRLGDYLLDPNRIDQQPTQRHLLGLLCRTRLHLARQLEIVLQQAWGPHVHPLGLPLLAGCYVAALSENLSKCCFTSPIPDRLIPLQGELEWSPSQRSRDARAHAAAWIFFLVTAGLLAASAAAFALRV